MNKDGQLRSSLEDDPPPPPPNPTAADAAVAEPDPFTTRAGWRSLKEPGGAVALATTDRQQQLQQHQQ